MDRVGGCKRVDVLGRAKVVTFGGAPKCLHAEWGVHCVSMRRRF